MPDLLFKCRSKRFGSFCVGPKIKMFDFLFDYPPGHRIDVEPCAAPWQDPHMMTNCFCPRSTASAGGTGRLINCACAMEVAHTTADVVQAAARKYIDLDHLQIVCVGDPKQPGNDRNQGIGEVLKKYGIVEVYDTNGKKEE